MSTRVVSPRLATLAVASLAAAATAGAVALPPSALAAQVTGAQAPQGGGVVTGRVTESGSGRPVGEAQIAVVGTRLGAVTDANGNFRIANVPTGTQTLRVRRIGYALATQSVTVNAGGPTEVAFTLAPAATELDRIVVTGTPGATSQRTVGNAVTTLECVL